MGRQQFGNGQQFGIGGQQFGDNSLEDNSSEDSLEDNSWRTTVRRTTVWRTTVWSSASTSHEHQQQLQYQQFQQWQFQQWQAQQQQAQFQQCRQLRRQEPRMKLLFSNTRSTARSQGKNQRAYVQHPTHGMQFNAPGGCISLSGDMSPHHAFTPKVRAQQPPRIQSLVLLESINGVFWRTRR